MNSAINYSSLELPNFKNLFVPLDGTEWHEQAVSYSLLLGEWFNSKIDLFFSLADLPPLIKHGEWEQRAQISAPLNDPGRFSDPRLMDGNGALYEFGKILAYDYLGEITKRLEHLDLDIDVDVAAGSPAHILTYKAQKTTDSMIVMYARPQPRLRRYFAKKMADELISVATVPVLMLNDSARKVNHFREMTPESIIVPVRNHSAMRASLPIVAAIASKCGARIELLAPGALSKHDRKRKLPELEMMEGWLVDQGFDVGTTLYSTDPCNAVVDAQQRSDRPWVVVGSRMRQGITRSIFPSLADNVRREASCPVVLAPQREILPKRMAAIERWLIDWRADQDEVKTEAPLLKDSAKPVSVPNALIFFRGKRS